MARPIEATPTLEKEDALFLLESLKTRCSKEEAIKRRKRAIKALKENEKKNKT